MLEIEKKAHIPDIKSIQTLLAQKLDYKYDGDSYKRDLYFSDTLFSSYEDFQNLKTLFRVRNQDGQWYLTLKTKSFSGNTEVNSEREVLVQEGQGVALRDFFTQGLGLTNDRWEEEALLSIHTSQEWISFWEALGFFFVLDKEKKTHLYCANIDGFPVSLELNEIQGLGFFIEVEVLTEQEKDVTEIVSLIDKIFRDFHIDSSQEEPRLYVELLYRQKFSTGSHS